MSAATLQDSVDSGALLGDYLDHVASLGLSRRAVRDRIRIAREFVSRHPDLAAWMGLPAIERAAELRSSDAWPLLCYAIGTSRIALDVELAAIKQLTGLAAGSRHGTRPGSRRCEMREAGWAGAAPGLKRSSVNAWRCCWPGTAGWSPTSPRR
jgi:hypothetical protein